MRLGRVGLGRMSAKLRPLNREGPGCVVFEILPQAVQEVAVEGATGAIAGTPGRENLNCNYKVPDLAEPWRRGAVNPSGRLDLTAAALVDHPPWPNSQAELVCTKWFQSGGDTEKVPREKAV